MTLSLNSRRVISHAEYERLLKSVLRLQCKRELEKPDITHVFIKMSNFSGPVFPKMKELFPAVQQMFITRHFKASIHSYFKIARGLPQLWMKFGEGYRFFMNHMTFPIDDPHWWELFRRELRRGMTDEEGMTLALAGAIESFIRTKDNYDHVMLYEDIRAEPEKECRALFTAMGLDHKYIPDALDAMREDSQQGVLGIRGNAHIKLTEEEITNIARIFRITKSPISMDMSLDDLRTVLKSPAKVVSRRDSSDSGDSGLYTHT